MYGDGYLSVFTQMFGWHYYGYIWDILVASGLVYLPFLGILIDHVIRVRSQGSVLSNNGESAFAGLEVSLFVALLVIIIAAVPNSFTTLSASNFQHSAPASIYADATTVTAEDSGSTYDSTLSTTSASTASSVNVPPFWYLTIKVSQAINQTMIDSYDAKGHIFRQIKRETQHLVIENAELRDHLSQFKTECYYPALAQFEQDITTRGGQSSLFSDSSSSKVVGQDIGYIGSTFLLANYYPNIRVKTITPGFEYSATINSEYQSSPGAGTPLCNAYWNKLSNEIYKEAQDKGIPTLWQNVVTFWPDWAPGTDDIDIQNQVVMTYLNNTPVPILTNADQTIALRDADMGAIGTTLRNFGSFVGTFELGKTVLMLEAGLDALIFALYIGQAFILMVIYMMLGIGLLVAKYSIQYLMSASLLIFMVTFWGAIWALVGWLDGALADSMYNGENIIQTFTQGGPAELTKRLAHSLAIAALYIFAPIFSTWVLAAAGSNVAHVLGNASRLTAMGSSAGAIGRAAPTAARNTAGAVGRAASETFGGKKR